MGSPTFPLVQTYPTPNGAPFYHIDLYRLKSETELMHSGIVAQIEEPSALVCIEWASLFPDEFAHWFVADNLTRKKDVYLVNIELAENGTRHYVIEGY
jgi:tRNA A37 threonylcarbamoyladenosine biosynthesis protein TsaE